MYRQLGKLLGLRRGDRIILSILAALLLISFSYSLSLFLQPTDGIIARIEQDGRLLETIRLDSISEPFERTYRSGEHFNTIRAETGRICVIAANCPEQVDVRAGWLSVAGQSAVCIPHRFSVRLDRADGADTDIDVVIQVPNSSGWSYKSDAEPRNRGS